MTTAPAAPPSVSDPRSRDGLPVTDLLSVLVELKSWIREMAQGHRGDQATAALTTLATLERCGPCRVGALAEAMRVDVSVVSRHATGLEGDGLLVREVDPDDGRAHRLVLTDAGRAALHAGRARVAEHLSTRLGGWTDQEVTDLTATLWRLLRDLGREPAARA